MSYWKTVEEDGHGNLVALLLLSFYTKIKVKSLGVITAALSCTGFGHHTLHINTFSSIAASVTIFVTFFTL